MSVRISALAGALILASAGAGFAADLPPAPSPPPVMPSLAPEPAPEVGTNWYLRGDLGYATNQAKVSGGDLKVPFTDQCGCKSFSDTKLGNADSRRNTWTGGLGVGYDFGMIRADLTADYWGKAKVTADRLGDNDPNGGYRCETNADCRGHEQGKLDSWTLLANAYVDLGTWAGLTPYVGAGAGAARLHWDWSSAENCTVRNVAGSSCGPDYGRSTSASWDEDTNSKWKFAWALMAGASYAITPNLSVDAGYRFLDIRNAEVVPDPKRFGRTGEAIDAKDLYSHQVRVGLRYTID